MKVYKFGGASIATPQRMQNLLSIIRNGGNQLLVVVSAIGKTTNALESIVNAAVSGKVEDCKRLVAEIEEAHNSYASLLLSKENYEHLNIKLNELYTELNWALDDAQTQSKNYVYDQIICIGELLATAIFSAYLNENGINNVWLDARDLIKTDANYRDPNVNMELSKQLTTATVLPIINEGKIVITQGFIGSTEDNTSTTLGREGSDYSAALFASMLQAESVSIWKDVEGLYNADPRLFPNTVKIEEITYYEVIEMSYYGAQVIHPKTIKPLENANIPLYVKCFLDEKLKGTTIQKTSDTYIYPPLIVLKKNQILIQMTSLDFSFITEDNISKIYNIFASHQVKINLMQNAAISLVVCVDNILEKITPLVTELEKYYKVRKNENVQLLTVRHYTPTVLEEVTKGKVVLLEQKTRSTVQVVVN